MKSSEHSTGLFERLKAKKKRMNPNGFDGSSVASADSYQLTEAHARYLDAYDPLAHFRLSFHIPTVADLKRKTIYKPADEPESYPAIYLCGNSLGLQPIRTAELVTTLLTQWRTKAVTGHFTEHDDCQLAPFLHIDDQAQKLMAPIVGAHESEVAVMATLTVNLHLMMASFYKPDETKKGRWKIMLEGKAFPSDHFAVESQIAHHNLNPKEAMVLLEPSDPANPIISTQQILKTIDEHASELALILLPGVQFYTGQYFDMATITAHAHSHGILIGWDLAHAVGNVDLKLHEWDVDFAVWCSYKYLNSGPGAMAGIFVNERFGKVDLESATEKYWPRFSGWWGDDKSGRFKMTNNFVPRPGAAGFQLSNPSALDMAAVVASLQVFNKTTMKDLRSRSIRLTAYLEKLLDNMFDEGLTCFSIVTPRNPKERGAQLSIRLSPGLLEPVLAHLEANGVIVDERKPDVIRVAPAPLYNSFEDVWNFCKIFRHACAQGTNQAEAS